MIILAKVTKQLRRTANWKASGPDGLQRFWLKGCTSCKGELPCNFKTVWQQTKFLNEPKGKEKGNAASNYKPITRLPLMWKLCTGIMGDELYNDLEKKHLLPDEQKGCGRNSKGKKDQLIIGKMVTRNCKRRQIGLAMAWVVYKKAYVMIPHSWIIKCLQMFVAAEYYGKVSGKEYGSVENGTYDRRTAIMHCWYKERIISTAICCGSYSSVYSMLLSQAKAGYDPE